MTTHIALIGGGPAALLMYKRLVEERSHDLSVEIFEGGQKIGCGMPYSEKGASLEHVTNVSADELPHFTQTLTEWVKALPDDKLRLYGIKRNDFHEKECVPRLLFGEYLNAQFEHYIAQAERKQITTKVHLNTQVRDISQNKNAKITVTTDGGEVRQFDKVIICTGHRWTGDREGAVKGYFDSPYPPAKLKRRFNHEVALLGSSLTAIDAIRTIARSNGKFEGQGENMRFVVDANSPDFRIMMHSIHGLLPALRVHMEEPHTAVNGLLPQDKLDKNMLANDGFLELDYLFEKGFKEPLKESDPDCYSQIKDLNLEAFVDRMMSYRNKTDSFDLFDKEYQEAKKSIRKEEPVFWKEMLSGLSFAMNYPAKHMSAEDMRRLQKTLKPLISVVIAFAPQESAEELMALHRDGRLAISCDGKSGKLKVKDDGTMIYTYTNDGGEHETIYQSFIDCTGQTALNVEFFPFRSLLHERKVSGAKLQYRSRENGEKAMAEEINKDKKTVVKIGEEYFLKVPGVTISDHFQLIDEDGKANEQIYLMAVPYIGGYNPDYSGLDFCETASKFIVKDLFDLEPVS